MFCVKDIDLACLEFKTKGYVRFDRFLSSKQLEDFRKIYQHFSFAEKKKNFLMPQSDFTPRKMSIVSGSFTAENSYLMEIYHSFAIKKLLSLVTNLDITDCPSDLEKLIFTALTEQGDTHGWHLDEFPIALVVMLYASPSSRGGKVELQFDNEVHIESFSSGDAYLIRSDIVRHRVTPLLSNDKRVIMNFTYSIAGIETSCDESMHRLCI